jgi:hypothetical protein
MVDPADVKLRQVVQKQALHTEVADSAEASVDDMRELYISQMLDQAFAVDNKDIRDYVVDALSNGNRVDLSDLPVTEDARSLLNAMRAIEVAAVNDLSSDYQFTIGYLDDDNRQQDFNALQGYIGRQGRFYLELINKG